MASTSLSERSAEHAARSDRHGRPRPSRAERFERIVRIAAPLAIGCLALVVWEAIVAIYAIPHYILPGPSLVLRSLIDDWGTLFPSLLVTLQITFMALGVATIGGVALAILFTTSKWIELSFFPFAVILQVTPIISIAPLILIYVDNVYLALLICAWIVAFFPILSNTTLGLQQRRPQPGRPVPALWRQPLADALAPAPALGHAVLSGRASRSRAGCR